jgi:hypothetical protein
VTGECGHLPSVRVWDVQERVSVGEFPGHKAAHHTNNLVTLSFVGFLRSFSCLGFKGLCVEI